MAHPNIVPKKKTNIDIEKLTISLFTIDSFQTINKLAKKIDNKKRL